MSSTTRVPLTRDQRNAFLAALPGWTMDALIGGFVFGGLSQRYGRRHTAAFCTALGLPVLPIFAYSTTAGMLCLGAFLMQIVIQGAWAIIPAHLTEMSPPAIQEALSTSYGYPFALVATMVPVLISVIVLLLVGKEAKDMNFSQTEPARVGVAG
jgi:SHS family lactate transporter-like MFS transporter